MFNFLFVAFLVAEGTIVVTTYVGDFVKRLNGKDMDKIDSESDIANKNTTTKQDRAILNISSNNGLTDDYNTNYRLSNMDIRDTQDLLAMDYEKYSSLSDYDRTYVDKTLNELRRW